MTSSMLLSICREVSREDIGEIAARRSARPGAVEAPARHHDLLPEVIDRADKADRGRLGIDLVVAAARDQVGADAHEVGLIAVVDGAGALEIDAARARLAPERIPDRHLGGI